MTEKMSDSQSTIKEGTSGFQIQWCGGGDTEDDMMAVANLLWLARPKTTR